MSKIQINNLQVAGSELFQGGESFLTELQATEAHTIYGGGSKKKSGKGSGKKSGKKKSGGPTIIVLPGCCTPCYH
jgi:hypothetical protein